MSQSDGKCVALSAKISAALRKLRPQEACKISATCIKLIKLPLPIDRSLKPGDSFSYHGTDFLQLDPCSGLIKHVDIAQDSLWFYHNLGVPSVNV